MLKLKNYRKLLILGLIPALVFFTSGCSFTTLSEKVFGKKKVDVTVPADHVLVDAKELTKLTTEMITGAKKAVFVEQYEFDRKDLMELLIKKAKEGVEVKVLLDQSPKSAKTTYEYLRSNGVKVQYYPTQKGQFHKAKLLSVDYTKAIIGGNDWTTEAAANHDVGMELDGKSAWSTVSLVFARDWKFATATELNLPDMNLEDDHLVLATNANIKMLLTKSIQQAKQSIQAELTVLDDRDVVDLLVAAAAAGKQVQVILDPGWSKTNRSAIEKLKAAGGQLRYYPVAEGQKQYARFGLFDGTTTLIGGANWSYYSFVINHELAVSVPSSTVTAKLGELFAADWKKSKDIELDNNKKK